MLRALPLIVLLVFAGTAVASHLDRPPGGHGERAMIASTKGFQMTGLAVKGLYPGAATSMKVTIRNPYAFAIAVSPIAASLARGTSRPGCAGTTSNLVVTPPRTKLVIRAFRSGSLTLRVSMPRSVADACQGAAFKVTLKGRAGRH